MPCSTASRRKQKRLLAFIVRRANDKSPLCVLFSGLSPAFALWDGCLQPGRDEHPSGGGQQKETQTSPSSPIQQDSIGLDSGPGPGPGPGMLWGVCVEADILMV